MTILTVLTGTPAGLRDALAIRVAELRRTDPLEPINVLVGASLQRPFLQRWLAGALGAHANVRMMMPGDLALALGAPSLVAAGRRALPPLADRVLLAEVARGHAGYFAPVADTPGFGEALFRLVRELRGAGYDLSALDPILTGTTDSPEKASALTDILGEFERRRSGFYGPDDALAAADAAALRGMSLEVYGLLDLTPALERLLLAIAERMPVRVYVTDLRAAQDTLAAQLPLRLGRAGAARVSAPGPTRPGAVLDQVRGALFTDPGGEPLAADGTVRLVSAPDPSREVRAAARACLAWAGEGVPLWDMAVAYRHAEAYLPLIEAVFVEAGLPVYLHEGSPLAQRPLGRQTLGLLDLFDSDLSRQSVMDFLTDARVPDALRDRHRGIPAARWDALSRDAGVVRGAAQWQSRLGAMVSGADPEDPEWVRERAQDAAALAAFVDELDRGLAAHLPRGSWAAHLDYLQGLLSTYIEGADEVVVALRGLERFTALEAEIEFAWFLDVVRRAIATLRSEDVTGTRPGAFAARGVNIVAVNSLAGIEFDRVWILGATERAFPAPVRQDPILLDDERRRISARASTPLASRAERGSEESLIFALAGEAARERLVVSYARRATGEGRPRLPSVFFREVASQLEGRRVSAEEAPMLVRADVERIPGNAIGVPVPANLGTSAEGISAAAAIAVSQSERDRTFLQAAVTKPLAIATFELAQPSFARALRAAEARFARRYSEWDGALGAAAVDALIDLMPADRPYSPTALQTYAVCPQRFMLEQVLRVRSIEEPEQIVRIDALSRGTLVHRIFERFFAEWTGSEPAPVAAGAMVRMRRIAEQECDLARDRNETGYPAMWEADREEIIDDCLRWLDIERRDPVTRALPEVAVEASFGLGESGTRPGDPSQAEPVEITLPSGPLRLRGRIDRVTWNADRTRFQVVDYKTGGKYAEKPGELQGGKMLQLPLYVLAAAALLDIAPTGGAAAYAYASRKGGFQTVAWQPDDIAARHDDVIGVLDAIITGVSRGDFLIAPADHACDYCQFNGACPGAQGAYAEAKSSDERLTQFVTTIRNVP